MLPIVYEIVDHIPREDLSIRKKKKHAYLFFSNKISCTYAFCERIAWKHVFWTVYVVQNKRQYCGCFPLGPQFKIQRTT